MSEESGDQAITRRERVKNWAASHPAYVFLIIIGTLFFLLMVAFPDYFPSWLGLRELKNDSGEIVSAKKTAWDWLELLIVPAMLAGGAAWIARSQQKRELEEREVDREIAKQARESDRELAEKARETDREIAKDRQEQATLDNYYDRMAELLLTHDLRSKTDENDEERSIAKARTLTVLRSLNAARKGQVLRFLHESKLIGFSRPVLVLSAADLTKADLSLADLSGANLSEANLTGAKLFAADLSISDLSGAKLEGGNLFGANLSGAKLGMANLIGANLEQAKLRGANLSKADLSWAKLSWAKYTTNTKWPPNFDPKAAGAILVEDEGNPIEDSE